MVIWAGKEAVNKEGCKGGRGGGARYGRFASVGAGGGASRGGGGEIR